jgi:hypothetical protein
MAEGGTALRTSDLIVTLVQSGGIAGLEMQAVLKLSELHPWTPTVFAVCCGECSPRRRDRGWNRLRCPTRASTS